MYTLPTGEAVPAEQVPSDVPMDSPAGTEDPRFPKREKLGYTLAEKLRGAGETGLTMATGIAGGTLGTVQGFGEGLVKAIRSGEFGTKEAADMIEKMAMERAAQYADKTYQFLSLNTPKSEAGQEYIKETGEALAPMQAIPSVAGELNVLSQIARAASKMPKIFKTQSAYKQKIADDIMAGKTDRNLAKYIVTGSGKVKADKAAKSAIKQGFDEGVVSAIKGATPEDRFKMTQMVNVLKKGKENALYSQKNRPSDIAGKSLLNRVNHIKKVNRDAGAKLDRVAKSLKGKQVDFSDPVNNFMSNLDDMGIKLDKNNDPVFIGSDIEQLSGPQMAVKNIVNRLKSGKKGVVPDAYELHRLKKYIDENVTYGKMGEGLKGKTERVLKQLRADVDNALDQNFKQYNKVNTTYADTVSAIDSLQNVAGKKMDLFGPNANKAVGTLLRRMMSNAQSRINLVDAVDDIERIARKYKGKFKDDIATQMLFADELDTVFGPTARTSLAGETGKAIRTGGEAALGQKTAAGLALEAGSAIGEKARGINQANAFKAINELLMRK